MVKFSYLARKLAFSSKLISLFSLWAYFSAMFQVSCAVWFEDTFVFFVVDPGPRGFP